MGGTQVLKQSLKDLQEMLKLTQSKLNKQQSVPCQNYKANDEVSFLKKLTKQSEMQTNIMLANQNAQTYANRYSVNSPKYKENLNILNSNSQSNQPNPL